MNTTTKIAGLIVGIAIGFFIGQVSSPAPVYAQYTATGESWAVSIPKDGFLVYRVNGKTRVVCSQALSIIPYVDLATK